MGAFLHLSRGAHDVTCSVTPLAALALTPAHQSYLLEAPDSGTVVRGRHSAGVLSGSPFRRWFCSSSGTISGPAMSSTGPWPGGGARSCWPCSHRVITENDPQPRDGPLRPEFTATFGSVSWLGFVIEVFSFFVEGIFIGNYVYGWERLVSRLHLRSGIAVVSAAATSAAAGTVQMGADPHWRVRRPPPDLSHQLVTQRESGAIRT